MWVGVAALAEAVARLACSAPSRRDALTVGWLGRESGRHGSSHVFGRGRIRQAGHVSDVEQPAEVVRSGYDAASYLYRSDDECPPEYAAWIDALLGRLPAASRVLDLGCGCGIPVARMISGAGAQLTGVDLSDTQIQRARGLVPAATFISADMTTVDLPAGSFDAVVCLYSIIHVPLERQLGLVERIGSWLAPGGTLLLSGGWQAWTGTEECWLGGSAPMWWSHADVDTYRAWITGVGLRVESVDFVPEGAPATVCSGPSSPATTRGALVSP